VLPNLRARRTKIAASQFASQKTKIVSPHFASQKKPFQHHHDSPHFFAEGKWRDESQLGRRITTKVSGEDQNDQVPKTKTGNQPIVLEQQQDQKQMKRHWNQKNDELSSPPKPKIKQACHFLNRYMESSLKTNRLPQSRCSPFFMHQLK
jgi:hypothetical protein